MPILELDWIGPIMDSSRRSLARRVADAAGAALGAEPRTVWVRVRFAAPDEYAENESPALDEHPVIVRILSAEPPQGEALADESRRLTEAIAQACGRPTTNVHLIWEPPGRGRVSFGGTLRT